jgi:hypothetical protein
MAFDLDSARSLKNGNIENGIKETYDFIRKE